MNTHKRVNQMAHLKQTQISDNSCKAIIIDTILESVRPLTQSELSSEITSIFHILVSPERLNSQINELCSDRIIYFENASDWFPLRKLNLGMPECRRPTSVKKQPSFG